MSSLTEPETYKRAVHHDDRLYVPQSWTHAQVDDVFESWGGATPSTSESRYWGAGIPWVSSGDIKSWVLSSTARTITQTALEETRLRVCPVGSVLVVIRSGVLVHSLPVAITDCPVVINQDLKAFASPEPLLNEWLALTLQWKSQEILEVSRKDGTTVQSIRYGGLKYLSIPIPPLAEQKRIVAKVEQVLARVNTTRERLAKVPKLMKRFRQSVLAAACSGRLTADWRDARELSGRGADGELPVGWRLIPFGDVTNNLDGRRIPVKSDDRAKRRGEFPYYGASGIVDSIDKYLFDGTFLLISEDGANLVRRSTPIAFQAKGKFWVNHHAHVVGPKELAALDYLELFINSIDLQDYITGSAQPKLTQRAMNSIPVPLPPKDEQVEIAKRVGAISSLVSTIQRRTETVAKRVGTITQSVLAKAFRGELVSTEAELAETEGRDYETAEALLERIRRERAAGSEMRAKSNGKSKAVGVAQTTAANHSTANGTAGNSVKPPRST